MGFENTDFAVPERLETEEFVLRPIRETDAALDFDAVMESRDFLRVWEQTSWPEDDFTVEANREDMVLLERRHTSRGAFTFTVMNPEETECLGCVYLIAHNAKMFQTAEITQIGRLTWEGVDTTVYFWVRKSRLAGGMDARLLSALRSWFESEWPLDNVVFVTADEFRQQVGVIEEAGLTPQFKIQEQGKAGTYTAYAPA